MRWRPTFRHRSKALRQLPRLNPLEVVMFRRRSVVITTVIAAASLLPGQEARAQNASPTIGAPAKSRNPPALSVQRLPVASATPTAPAAASASISVAS